MRKKKRTWNFATRLAWADFLENCDLDLESYAAGLEGVELAVKIDASFRQRFRDRSCPFARHAFRRTINDVNFRELAERLRAMLRRRQSARR